MAYTSGMIVADAVAAARGLMSEARRAELAAFHRHHIRVPVKPEHAATARIAEAMKKDKKRTGEGLALVMLTEAYGMVKVNDLTIDELEAAGRVLAAALGTLTEVNA